MPSSYTLGDHFEAFIQELLRSGRYATASEVLREGLRLMEEAQERRTAELKGLREGAAKPARRGAARRRDRRRPTDSSK